MTLPPSSPPAPSSPLSFFPSTPRPTEKCHGVANEETAAFPTSPLMPISSFCRGPQPSPDHRLTELPPLSSDSLVMSSPVRTKADRRRKAQKARARTLESQKAKKRLEEEAQKLAEDERKRLVMQAVLEDLDTRGIAFSELLLYAFNYKNTSPDWRWRSFFSKQGAVSGVMSLWASTENSDTGRRAVRDAAIKTIQGFLQREADNVGESGILRTRGKAIDADFVLGLNFKNFGKSIERACPVAFALMKAIATTKRQQDECKKKTLEHKDFIVASAISSLLGERSRQNNHMQHVLGLYLYATGATRQQISVLNHFGLSISYA
ncbi:hypothetical protein EVG20_g9098, partial [Dentipellis fragilis]